MLRRLEDLQETFGFFTDVSFCRRWINENAEKMPSCQEFLWEIKQIIESKMPVIRDIIKTQLNSFVQVVNRQQAEVPEE
jgi:hypothetical protein